VLWTWGAIGVKLKVQSMFIICLSMILFFTFLILVTRPLLMKNAVLLDQVKMENDMEMFENYIETEKEYLNRLSLNWAARDETYEFINNINQNYIERNLLGDAFENFEIAYMFFFDRNNKYIYGKGIEPINWEFKTSIQDLIKVHDYQENAFIVRTTRGLAFVDVEPVFRNNGKGISNGNFVMIRFIDKKFLTSVENELAIDLVKYDQVTRAKPPSYETRIVNDKELQGTLYLSEEKADEYSQFVLQHKREYYLEKSKSINELFVIFFTMILLFIFLIYVLLDHLIVSRVSRLSKQLRSIQKSKDISNRLSHSRKSKDEIYILERTVNEMLFSLEESHDEIKRLAYHDYLTLLPNRYRLQNDFDFFVESSERIAVLFLDLDGFKVINDTYGHAAGNLLLIEVANRLTAIMKNEPGMVSRIGGDEFIVLIRNKDRQELAVIGELITQTISEPYLINEMEMQITTSLGISQLPEDGHTFEELVNHADSAMYKSKRNGKNQTAFYSEQLSPLHN
jgi:diguanylate cyclase (GGDEF)-like protein